MAASLAFTSPISSSSAPKSSTLGVNYLREGIREEGVHELQAPYRPIPKGGNEPTPHARLRDSFLHALCLATLDFCRSPPQKKGDIPHPLHPHPPEPRRGLLTLAIFFARWWWSCFSSERGSYPRAGERSAARGLPGARPLPLRSLGAPPPRSPRGGDGPPSGGGDDEGPKKIPLGSPGAGIPGAMGHRGAGRNTLAWLSCRKTEESASPR